MLLFFGLQEVAIFLNETKAKLAMQDGCVPLVAPLRYTLISHANPSI